MLFTDVVGSTELAARIGDRKWRELLATYRALVRRMLRRTDGREVDDAGDGFFAVFNHPADAIACACLLSDEVRDVGSEVRSGIHMGEAETAGPKPGGIAVHIGARVCSQAGPGQVLVSATVRDVMRGSEYGFIDLGEHALKGVPGEIRLFSVTWGRTHISHPPGHEAVAATCLPGRRSSPLWSLPLLSCCSWRTEAHRRGRPHPGLWHMRARGGAATVRTLGHSRECHG